MLQVRRLDLESPVSVSTHGLLLVRSAAEQLLRGATSIDSLWPGSAIPLPMLLNDEKLLTSSLEDLYRLRRASETLAKLQASVDVKISILQRTTVPASQHHGLHNLPDELLLTILRHCTTNSIGRAEFHPFMPALYDKEREDLRKLSLVSRRFRDLIYSTGELWRDIGQWMSPSRAQRQLAMCGSTPLHLSVNHANEKDVFGLIDRCSFLRIRPTSMTMLRRPPWMDDGSIHAGRAKPCILLPSVTTLSAHCLPLTPASDALFSQYSFPNLRTLFLSGLTPSLPSSLLHGITTLRMCGIDGGVDVSCAVVLSTVLLQTPALQRLSFACSVSDLQFLTTRAPRAHLPRLEACTMCFCFRKTINGYEAAMDDLLASVVSNISQIMDMPNLESLFLHFEAGRPTALGKLSVSDMFPVDANRKMQSKVRKIELGASPANDESRDLKSDSYSHLVDVFLPSLLQRFSSTKTLTLSIPYTRSIPDGDNELIASLASLKTLRLRDCSHLQFDSLIKTLALVFERENTSLQHLTLPGGYSHEMLRDGIWNRLHKRSRIVFE